MKLAVVHDLAEALAGDIAPFQKVSKEEKRRLEEEGLAKICATIGQDPIGACCKKKETNNDSSGVAEDGSHSLSAARTLCRGVVFVLLFWRRSSPPLAAVQAMSKIWIAFVGKIPENSSAVGSRTRCSCKACGRRNSFQSTAQDRWVALPFERGIRFRSASA